MKKTIALLLALFMLVTGIGSFAFAVEPDDDDIKADEPQELAVYDYGTPEFIQDTVAFMEVNIAYPKGFEAMDTILQAWADDLVKTYADIAMLLPADENGIKGSLSVDYYSYMYENYASILELGEFDANVSGAYRYIVKGFIFDMDRQELVAMDRLFTEKEMLHIYHEVIYDAVRDGVDLSAIPQEVLLENCALYNNMVIVAYTDGNVVYHVRELYDGRLPIVTPEPEATPTPTPTPVPTATPAPTPTAKPVIKKGYVSGNKVHIRAEASSKSKSLALVPIGYELEVVEIDAVKGWTKILFQGKEAYIFTNYVAFKQPKPKVVATGYVTGKTVYVRSEPNTTSEKLGIAKYQNAVKIIMKEYVQGWDQILYNGKVAYISSKYIADVKPTPTPTAAPKPKQVKPSWYAGRPDQGLDIGIVKTNNVQAKTAADDNANYYVKLQKNDTVFIVEQDKTPGWVTVWIETPEDATLGYFAYVQLKYLTIEHFVGPVY